MIQGHLTGCRRLILLLDLLLDFLLSFGLYDKLFDMLGGVNSVICGNPCCIITYILCVMTRMKMSGACYSPGWALGDLDSRSVHGGRAQYALFTPCRILGFGSGNSRIQHQKQEALQQAVDGLTAQLQLVVANVETLVRNQGKQKEDVPYGSTSHMGNPLFEEHGSIQTRAIRLDFSKFDGEEPNDWIYRVTQFFTYHQTNPYHRVLLASFHMEGKALTWFQDLEASGGITSWEGFTQSLLTRFGPSILDDPMETLTRLRQTTTMEAYKT
ncbi:hypothetical protein F0562_030122 [Nyssa sinensis]|uniref:Retrotransposon gag domain-containing protein n=1 Tax=Nyssa sinensis TaxID=561372 RepID=A0A5J5AXI3_9ASTE|nr:hypothetical protein F0562_030122 [Nyssa sinensis]